MVEVSYLAAVRMDVLLYFAGRILKLGQADGPG